MNSPNPIESERGFFGNKYVLAIVIALVTIFLINSWYLSQFKVVQGSDFTIPTISGDSFSIGTNRGKVVVINFMATSCPYCRAEIPELKKVWDVYGGKIVMVSISVDPLSDSDGILLAFANSYNASWIWARDTVGAVVKYQVTGTPTTVIIDQEGQVKYRHEGFTDASTFLKDLDALVNQH